MEIAIAQGLTPDKSAGDQLLLRMWLHGRSENTASAYRRDAQQFLAFAAKPIGEIVLNDLQAWAATLDGAAPNTPARPRAGPPSAGRRSVTPAGPRRSSPGGWPWASSAARTRREPDAA